MPPSINTFAYEDTHSSTITSDYWGYTTATSLLHSKLSNKSPRDNESSSPRKIPRTTGWHPPKTLPDAAFSFLLESINSTQQNFESINSTQMKLQSADSTLQKPQTVDSTQQKLQSADSTQQKPNVQPDIDWQPDYTKWVERVKRNKTKRRHEFSVRNQLPTGYPRKLESPAVWSGDDLKGKESEFIIGLTAEDISEAEKAVKSFKGLNKSMSELSKENFPLPTLGPKLLEISKGLDHGLGFFVLRGFNPKKYSSEENVILYTGISSYVAEKRGRQDENANMLLHLVDLGNQVAPDNVRQAPYSNVSQPYHTDLGEVIGLYALDQAAKGGRSKLASAGKVYNDLASSRPDYIHTLNAPDWIFDRFGQTPAYVQRPLLYHDGKKQISFTFSRRQLTGSTVSPRSKNIPAMSEIQAEALDAVHFTAEKHCISLECRRGDMQFWNNLAILHAREGFSDDHEAGKRRHLLRLWLRRENSPWKSPHWLNKQLKEVYDCNDSDKAEEWPIEPIKDYEHVTTQRRSSGHG